MASQNVEAINGCKAEEMVKWLEFPPSDDLKSLALATTAADDVDPVPNIPEPGKGGADVESIIYVKFNPNMPEKAKLQLAKLQAATEINAQYFSVKAGEAANIKIQKKELPGDMSIESQVKRSVHRAKVVDYVISNSSWLALQSTQAMQKKIVVRKEQFHKTLLDAILAGLFLPQTIYGRIEAILSSIYDGIKQAKETSVKQMYWVLLTVYKWDAIQERVFASFRTVYFEVSQTMKEYVSRKSTVTEVDLELGYKQDDFNLTESMWDLYRDRVMTIISKNDPIRDPIDIPVD